MSSESEFSAKQQPSNTNAAATEAVRVWREQTPSGRFLKFDERTGFYNDMGDMAAIKKAMRVMSKLHHDLPQDHGKCADEHFAHNKGIKTPPHCQLDNDIDHNNCSSADDALLLSCSTTETEEETWASEKSVSSADSTACMHSGITLPVAPLAPLALVRSRSMSGISVSMTIQLPGWVFTPSFIASVEGELPGAMQTRFANAIGAAAGQLRDCAALTTFHLDDEVSSSLGVGNLRGCSSLVNVRLPGGHKPGVLAFQGCSSLKTYACHDTSTITFIYVFLGYSPVSRSTVAAKISWTSRLGYGGESSPPPEMDAEVVISSLKKCRFL